MQGWTPIALAADPEPRLEWADLRGHRFNRPFFHQTLQDWETGKPAPTRWTGFDALDDLDTAPSLDPSLIIAHAARCGSSLLAQQIAALDGSILVAEPIILGQLLAYGIDQPAAYPGDKILRQAVRALGRSRFGDETRYVLKLSSMMTRFLPLFRRAFPGVPMVWLQRQPAEIAESEIHAPGRWIGVGKSRGEGSGERLNRMVLHKLALVFLAARTHVTDDMLVLDYRDLPEAAWTKVLALMQVTASDDEVRRMRHVASRDGHTGKPFSARQTRELSEKVQAVVTLSLDPLYRALDRRRSVQHA